jgi:hypothetical protein
MDSLQELGLVLDSPDTPIIENGNICRSYDPGGDHSCGLCSLFTKPDVVGKLLIGESYPRNPSSYVPPPEIADAVNRMFPEEDSWMTFESLLSWAQEGCPLSVYVCNAFYKKLVRELLLGRSFSLGTVRG